MFYVPIKPGYMEKYLRGDSVYLGPTTPANYRVMSTRVNPYSGELEITGMREEQGFFPVLPGMFLSYMLMGIWNFLTGRFFSWFGVKPEHNPLRLQFHYGYALREDSPPQGYTGEGYAGYGRNGNGKKQYPGTNGWERELGRELYPWD